MPHEPIYFDQYVSATGFLLLKVDTKTTTPGLFLTSGQPMGSSYGALRFRPMNDEPALFRTFAEIDESDANSIQSFANKYGLLGIVRPNGQERWIPVRDSPSGGKLMGDGENIDWWKPEIRHLRTALALYDAATTGNTQLLGNHLTVVENKGIRYENHGVGMEWIVGAEDGELFARCAKDLSLCAMIVIQKEVNRKLVELNVSARLLWDTQRTRLSLRMMPQSLLGCLWLQLAKAIDGERAYRQCGQCRKWFEIKKGAARADKNFCSPTCRANAHRAKIAQARALAVHGLSPEEIALRLDTVAETVQGWLAK